MRKGVMERRLNVTFYQRQWQKPEDLRIDMDIMTMKLVLWSDQCNQLFPEEEDLTTWTAIMKVNPIPFYAAVCVDGSFSKKGEISLSTLAIHWDLRTYLKDSCLELSLATVKKWLPTTKVAAAAFVDKGDGVVNMSATGHVPPGCRYYALTANGAKSADQLAKPLILFALKKDEEEEQQSSPSAVVKEEAAKPSSKKRQKTQAKATSEKK